MPSKTMTKNAWYALPSNKCFSARNVSGTVTLQYKISDSDTAKTLYEFTSDGAQHHDQPVHLVRWTGPDVSPAIVVEVSYVDNL